MAAIYFFHEYNQRGITPDKNPIKNKLLFGDSFKFRVRYPHFKSFAQMVYAGAITPMENTFKNLKKNNSMAKSFFGRL